MRGMARSGIRVSQGSAGACPPFLGLSGHVLMMGTTGRRHQRIRLDPSDYGQPVTICSVTIAVRNRRPVFGDVAIANAAVAVLRDRSEETGVAVYAYCIMPDHIYLIIAPSETCDVVKFVGQFKNLVQREAWALGVKGAFWQLSFWDHFLRRDEDLESCVRYVFNNPVRAGLAQEPAHYPFSGSLVFDGPDVVE